MTGFNALPMADEAGLDGTAQWAGVARVLGPPWARFPVITIGFAGMQALWSVEMAYASPYLISLGLSKSLMALVFVAGPLSGLIMQPLIGVMADNSKSRFGRRRPFIVWGVALCTLALLLLGFTRNFASIVTTWGSPANDVLTIWLAVLSIYCIDFSINAVMAVDRALLVDTLPRAEQAKGNCLGGGYGRGRWCEWFFFPNSGGINLPSLFPFFGSTELEVLSVVGSIILIGTHLTTVTSVKERILLTSGKTKKSFLQELSDIWANMRNLPSVIRTIVRHTAFASMGWFPIFFYTTLYVSELYKRSLPSSAFDGNLGDIDAEGTRLGSRAQLFSAIVALLTNALAPLIVDGSSSPTHVGPPKRWWQRKIHLATLWAISHLIFAFCMFGTIFTSSATGATMLITILGVSSAISLWAPFSLLAEAIHATPDPVAGEADFDDDQSILLADTSTHQPLPQTEELFSVEGEDADDDEAVATRGRKAARESWDDDGNENEAERYGDRDILMGNLNARHSFADVSDFEEDHLQNGGAATPSRRNLGAKAGVILGIQNIFIVIPQFLVTGMTSLIFAMLEPHKSVLHGDHPGKTPPSLNTTATTTDNDTLVLSRQEVGANGPPTGPNSVAIIFRIGGIWAIIAFVLSWRLAKELRRHY
ncbi:MFS general substrate transporter [Lactarius sanguifluus]|nr:MFS general substrate transporter [Lactarius sanguifluus]